MIIERIHEIRNLTPSEKLILVGELWDDLAKNPADVPVSREAMDEVKRRKAEYERDPEGNASSWEEVKARLVRSRK